MTVFFGLYEFSYFTVVFVAECNPEYISGFEQNPHLRNIVFPPVEDKTKGLYGYRHALGLCRILTLALQNLKALL